jgi:hypothetical protein
MVDLITEFGIGESDPIIDKGFFVWKYISCPV